MQSLEKIIGKKLFGYIKSKSTGLHALNVDSLKNLMLKLSISNSKLQQQLFRFVDVLPSLNSPQQITEYLLEYLSAGNANFNKNPIVNRFIEFAVNNSVKILAKSFIVGSNVEEAYKKIQKLEKKGQGYTLDILGELALTQEEADRYHQGYLDLIHKIPNANISVKLSALMPQINSLDYQNKKLILKNKLRVIYKAAQEFGCFVNVDTEHYAFKDFTYEIIRDLLLEPEFKNWTNAGIVIQAYLKESEKDLRNWITWVKDRRCPITVRLVKGAYWDYEHAYALQRNWEIPVFTCKNESDINYEKLTEILLDHYQVLRPAIASHNIRSLSHALSYATSLNIDKSKFEFQMLYGMMDQLKEYLVKEDYTIRVYMPYGDLIPGMSYLVRRLLENTANDSFLRQGFLDGKSIDDLLQDPKTIKQKSETVSEENFTNAPNIDFSKRLSRERMQEAILKLKQELKEEKLYPAYINSKYIDNDDYFDSFNPANPTEVLGRISNSTPQVCDQAIEGAQEAYLKWSKSNPELRASILKEAAIKLEKLRYRFNALLVLEAGKPWQEADGEVSEAVDFLNYYSEQALDLYSQEKLRSLPGEKNTTHYHPYGVSVIISPWNFPLAIMVGMSVAALVTGNSVIIKPSQQTSIIAYEFCLLLNAVLKDLAPDYSKGLVNFVPGDGKVIGSHLASHPLVRLIAFTGSSATGMKLNEIASSSRPVKKLIAEMGGKNAIIIDESADLDEAIPGVLYSAFGYAGQKCSACSRVIVLDSVYEEFTKRLVEAAREINICDPSDEACFVPPVIDINAQFKINKYIDLGKREAKVLLGDLAIPSQGYFVSPTIFTDISPDHPLAQEEIFGPVLVVLKAKDLDEAISIANNSQYGLTGGIYSRRPSSITKAQQEFQVGNLYINRGTTGAIPSRQAFGGLKESSIGFKAGGPNYLLQFVQEKTITENTMRRGFVGD